MGMAPTVETEEFYESNWGFSSGPTASSMPSYDHAFPLYRHIEKIIDVDNNVIIIEPSRLESSYLISDSESRLADDLREIIIKIEESSPSLSVTSQARFQLDRILSFFEVTNNDIVRNYIYNNLQYVKIIELMQQYLLTYFDDCKANLTLDVLFDPEDLANQFLRIIITVEESCEDALFRLKRFQREKLLEKEELIYYNISFDIIYI